MELSESNTTTTGVIRIQIMEKPEDKTRKIDTLLINWNPLILSIMCVLIYKWNWMWAYWAAINKCNKHVVIEENPEKVNQDW